MTWVEIASQKLNIKWASCNSCSDLNVKVPLPWEHKALDYMRDFGVGDREFEVYIFKLHPEPLPTPPKLLIGEYE